MPAAVNFKWEPGSIGPLDVQFTDLTVVIPPETGITNWLWHFNLGFEAPISGPQHPLRTYTLPGTYTVRLEVVTSPSGLSYTIDQQVQVGGGVNIEEDDSTSDGSDITGEVTTADDTVDEIDTNQEPSVGSNAPGAVPTENTGNVIDTDEEDGPGLPPGGTSLYLDCCCDCCSPVDWPASGLYAEFEVTAGRLFKEMTTATKTNTDIFGNLQPMEYDGHAAGFGWDGMVVKSTPRITYTYGWIPTTGGCLFLFMSPDSTCRSFDSVLGAIPNFWACPTSLNEGSGFHAFMRCRSDHPVYPNALMVENSYVLFGPFGGRVYFKDEDSGIATWPSGFIQGRCQTTAFDPGTGGNATQTIRFWFDYPVQVWDSVTKTYSTVSETQEFYMHITCTHNAQAWQDYVKDFFDGVSFQTGQLAPYGMSEAPWGCIPCACMRNGQIGQRYSFLSGSIATSAALNEWGYVRWYGSTAPQNPEFPGLPGISASCASPPEAVIRATGGPTTFTANLRVTIPWPQYMDNAFIIGRASADVDVTGDPADLDVLFENIAWTAVYGNVASVCPTYTYPWGNCGGKPSSFQLTR